MIKAASQASLARHSCPLLGDAMAKEHVYRLEVAWTGDRGTGTSGYRAYGRDSAEVFKRVGGRQIWAGRPDVVLTGPTDERWDIAFIAFYPSAGAFLEMVTDPGYREHVKHRQAAVEDSRLIRMDPIEELGEGFGE